MDEVKDIVDKLGYKLLSTKYINNKTNLMLEDRDGYKYLFSLSNLMNGHKPSLAYKNNPYSIDNIISWCSLNNKEFTLCSKVYKKAIEHLDWKCLRASCMEEFKSPWSNVLHGNGCPYCSGYKVSNTNCLATVYPELKDEWHPTKNGKLTPYDVTSGSDKDVWWLCKNKHEWNTKITHRTSNNRNCPYCSGRYPTKENNLFVKFPEICKEWSERNESHPADFTPFSLKKVWWVCEKGHEYKTTIVTRTSAKTGCPICAESKGEKRIRNWLLSKSIEFISQKEYKGLNGLGGGSLSYDFYLPKSNILIEYQGKQHEKYIVGFHNSKNAFYKQQEHDKRKREYADLHNISLLEIWYWDFENIEEILTNTFNNREMVI